MDMDSEQPKSPYTQHTCRVFIAVRILMPSVFVGLGLERLLIAGGVIEGTPVSTDTYILRRLIKPEAEGTQDPHIIRKSFVGVFCYLVGAAAAWAACTGRSRSISSHHCPSLFRRQGEASCGPVMQGEPR
jgi:hypothetical protein